MTSTTFDISAIENPSLALIEIWAGIRRFAEDRTTPCRVPPQAFDAIADHGTTTAREILPELAGSHPSFFRALIAFAGAQGNLNATRAAEFVANVAAFIPVNKADLAALARAAGYPFSLALMAGRDELRVATGKAGRLASNMATRSGHEFWLHTDEAGDPVLLIAALPSGLYSTLTPPRRGEQPPKFGLAA